MLPSPSTIKVSGGSPRSDGLNNDGSSHTHSDRYALEEDFTEESKESEGKYRTHTTQGSSGGMQGTQGAQSENNEPTNDVE